MTKKEIKEKKNTSGVKEKIDKNQERQSTKILRGVAIAVIVTIIFASARKIIGCDFNGCVLGGVGAGSVIVTLIWLVTDHLKGALGGA